MLKQIDTGELQVGMFVHKMGGSWLSPPFWKGRFAVEDDRQLSEILSSSVPWVMIDTEKGVDVAESAAKVAPAVEGDPTVIIRRNTPPPSRALVSLHREMDAAATLAGPARLRMRDCYAQARLGRAVDVTAVEPLVDEMIASIQRHPHAFNGVMRLMKTGDYLHTHALSVAALMISLALQLRLPAPAVHEAGLAGLLMDIGMGSVPQDIYDKTGPLNPAERSIMHNHTIAVRDLLSEGGTVPEAVLDVCLHHHERLDGSGYPHRLAGDALSLFARMAAICDSYDAMTSPRAHRGGAEPASVIATLRRETGIFDPLLVEAFVRAIGIYPIGSLVRLGSEHLAIVVDQNAKNPMLPKVRSFYSITGQRRIAPVTLDLVYTIGREDIVGHENPADWGFADWDMVSRTLIEDAVGIAIG